MQIKRLVSVLGIIVVMLTIAARGSGGGHPNSITRATMTLRGSDWDTAFYQLVNLTDTASRLSESGLRGFTQIQGLAFDVHNNTFYGTDSAGEHLIRIDPDTGVARAVGTLGFSNVRGLAFDPHTKTLYGAVSFPSQGELITINPITGAGTAVGRLGFRSVEGLAFDARTRTLYGTDTRTGQLLLTIDTATGAGTAVGAPGSLGFTNVAGLAFDPISNTLYGTSTSPYPGQLITIDPDTGAGTAAGVLGFSQLRGLAFDARTIRWRARTTIDPYMPTVVRPADDSLVSIAGSAHQ
ncbi:MAG: hypothetical protein OES46_20230 [Gammaproteobacteria bacterium]|jgi:sugar lactone lactonase YvrE|nr:hypothetical protein [Gammaproteobacteria bacterium]